jgi:ATP-dependent DNA helicase RecQ
LDEQEVGLFGARAQGAQLAGERSATPPARGLPATGAADLDAARALVASVFGFTSLRPLQQEAIEAGLAGRDALVVMPTGGGKSLCFQVPALLRDGLTVVVSPLISLMQDQVIGLREAGVAAGMLASSQDADERRSVEREVLAGRTKLLYVAPERLMSDGFLAWLDRAGLAAVAIDEAHCISHWGHDFRPEYRMLGALRTARPHLPIQAFTATATPEVRADILAELELRDPTVLVGGFDRPNLTYRVLPRRDLVSQVHAVIQRYHARAGIVYCLRRADVEKLAAELLSLGVRCAPYHAGLTAHERSRTQEQFLNEDLDVVVATVAFGMGIDRSDVRFVVHASLPKGLEQYSQETGRAGRDGMPAECVLFYGGADFHGWKNLIEQSAREAASQGVENAGADLDNALERLSHLWGFATGARCRHKTLCEYFGQPFESPGGNGCGACDVCLGEIRAVDDGKIVAQKILSCVVRCGQRFGAQHIADVLRGADTAKIRQTGHDSLSTFGLLAKSSNHEVRSWIDQLVGLGHLRVADGQYPTLFLSKSGVEVMRGDAPIALYNPVAPGSKSTARSRTRTTAAAALAAVRGSVHGKRAIVERADDATETPVQDEREQAKAAASTDRAGATPPDAAAPDSARDEILFETLRELRRSIARERGIPPYLVFNDRTLALLSVQKPLTPEGFRAVKGIGDKKAADLGAQFLEVIGAHIRSLGGTNPP